MKTVERWINTGRLPHRRHRWAVAALVKADETYLWPTLLDDARARSASDEELLALYPHRGAVPGSLWLALVDSAQESIDILVYAGLFLLDGHPDLPRLLSDKATGGIRVRIALGDPESDAVRKRGQEEGIGEALAARIHMSLTYLRDAVETRGVELRLHETPLYNSLYRFDNDLLVNTHAYGWPAAQSPVLHFRRLPGGRLFNHYLDSFERVWNLARPRTPSVA